MLIQFDRGQVVAHVRPGLPEEDDPGIHPLQAVARRGDRHFEKCRERDLERYREAKELARADLEIEPPRKWERKAPFRATKPKKSKKAEGGPDRSPRDDSHATV